MSQKKYTIRPETPADFRTVDALTRESFWNVYRPGCTEHYVLHCLRSDPAFVPELGYVMEIDGEIMGQIVFVRAEVECDDGSRIPVMTFGPICIAPRYKRQGYGKILLDTVMEKAAAIGVGALVTEGNILFYGKSGFAPAKTMGVRYADDPDAEYLIAKELQPGYLTGVSGVYRDPAGYFVAEKDPVAFARFDATFPEKEKQVLPGQLFS